MKLFVFGLLLGFGLAMTANVLMTEYRFTITNCFEQHEGKLSINKGDAFNVYYLKPCAPLKD